MSTKCAAALTTLLALFASSACATKTAHTMERAMIYDQLDPLATLHNLDSTAYRQDRQTVVANIDAIEKRAKAKSTRARGGYERWSALGIGSSLLAGVLALVLPHDNDRKNVATAGALVGGTATSWMVVKRFSTDAATGEKCMSSAETARLTFEGLWTDNDPPTTDAEKDQYRKARVELLTKVAAVCSSY